MLKAIRSRTEFPKLLLSLGVHCPMKHSEKQGKDIPAISKTDLAFTALLKHPDERVRLLVRARLEQNSSIQKSRAENLLKAGATCLCLSRFRRSRRTPDGTPPVLRRVLTDSTFRT